MADYVKIFLVWLLSIPICLQRSLASEDTDEAFCGFPGTPANGLVKPHQDQEAYNVGDVVTYVCDVGYILLGEPFSTCLEDGSWSERIPICDDSMTTIGEASASPTRARYPADMATDRNRETCTCLKYKKEMWWSMDLGEVHKILSVAITVPSTDIDMDFIIYVIEVIGFSEYYKRCDTFKGKTETLILRLVCDEGKGVEGQKVHIDVQSEDLQQNDCFTICEVEVQVEKAKKDNIYECGQPDRRPFPMTYKREGNEVKYGCKDGYELVGDSERKCLPSGQWSGELPACKPIVCKPLKALENGQLSYSAVNGDTPLEGSIVTYKCNQGYILEGIHTRSCLKDGSWSGRDPICTEPPVQEATFAKFGAIQFGWAVAAIMTIIIAISFFVVKRRREESNKPELPSQEYEPIIPPPRPPPRAKELKSPPVDLVSPDLSAQKYESLNLQNEGGGNALETPIHLPEPGSIEGVADDVGEPRQAMAHDDQEELASRDTGGQQENELFAPKEELKRDGSDEGCVATPDKSGGEDTAVDLSEREQSSLLNEQDFEDRTRGPSSAGDEEQLLEQPPIPKVEEQEETSAQSEEAASPPSTDKEKEQEEVASEVSADVRQPETPSDYQTSEAQPPSPDVTENQVEGPSASPPTQPPETMPGRRRRRAPVDEPSTEEVPEIRTRTRRRTISQEPESPPPETPSEEEHPARRTRAGRVAEPESPPAEDERSTRRTRGGRSEEPESPPAEEPDEEERRTRRTRPSASSRFDTPSATSEPSPRRRY